MTHITFCALPRNDRARDFDRYNVKLGWRVASVDIPEQLIYRWSDRADADI